VCPLAVRGEDRLPSGFRPSRESMACTRRNDAPAGRAADSGTKVLFPPYQRVQFHYTAERTDLSIAAVASMPVFTSRAG